MKSNSIDDSLWDRVGLSASLVCVVHCLLTPFLILFVPLIGHWFEQRWIHIVLAVFVVPVGAIAFRHGYEIHKRKEVIGLAAFGILALIAGLLFASNLTASTLLTIAGGLALVVAHLLNLHGCRCHGTRP